MSNTRIIPNSEWEEHKSVFSSHSEIPFRVLIMLKEWFLNRINRKKNAKKELAERETSIDYFIAKMRQRDLYLGEHYGYFNSVDEMPKNGVETGSFAMTKNNHGKYIHYYYDGCEWEFLTCYSIEL